MFFSFPFADKQALGTEKNTYGATGKSGFLFLMGSDMMTGGVRMFEGKGGGGGRGEVGEGKGGEEFDTGVLRERRGQLSLEDGGIRWESLAPVAGGPWRDALLG